MMTKGKTMKQLNAQDINAPLPQAMISIADSEAVTREVVGTTLNFLAEELEKSMAGEVSIEDVLKMVRMLAASEAESALH
jgi:hypothetical protein